jgi:hypothetical protein
VEERNESYRKFPMKSCVPKGLIGIIPIGTKSSKIPPQFLHSKGGLKVVLVAFFFAFSSRKQRKVEKKGENRISL